MDMFANNQRKGKDVAVMYALAFNADPMPCVKQWDDGLNVIVMTITMETHTTSRRAVIPRFVAKMATVDQTRRVFFCLKASEIARASVRTSSAV